MKKYISGSILAVSAIACGGAPQIVDSAIGPAKIAVLPIGSNDSVKGVSAPFTGCVNGSVIVGGGCNFPTAPASQGGKKQYYDDICIYSSQNDSWRPIGKLPQGLAYGASVVNGDEWICLGGNNNEGSSAAVYSVRMSADSCRVDTLPSLPESMDNFAAVKSGHRIYVAGGNMNGKAANKAFAFDLQRRDKWIRLADFPGPSRIQPLLLQGGNGGVLLMGGFQGGNLNEAPVLSEKVYYYSASHDCWSLKTSLPLSEAENCYMGGAGAFGVNINDSTLLIGGGVNQLVFTEALDADRRIAEAMQAGDTELAEKISTAKKEYLKHPTEWYRFNKELYLYNIVTDKWSLAGIYPETATAGSGATTDGNLLYVIGGELKPGVRTDSVYTIPISNLQQ